MEAFEPKWVKLESITIKTNFQISMDHLSCSIIQKFKSKGNLNINETWLNLDREIIGNTWPLIKNWMSKWY